MIALYEQSAPKLPSDDELKAAKTELRLRIREPKTRTLLRAAGDLGSALAPNWARDLRAARDDLATWIAANVTALGRKRTTLDKLVLHADRLVALTAHATTIGAVDADAGDAAAAMDALVMASTALDKLLDARAKARDLAADLAPKRRKRLVPKALLGDGSLRLAAVRDAVLELVEWASKRRIASARAIARSVAKNRPGGTLEQSDREDAHPGHETEDVRGWTDAGASLSWTWKMMSVSHLLGPSLLARVKHTISAADLTADMKLAVESALLAQHDGDRIAAFVEEAVRAIADRWPDASTTELDETSRHLDRLVGRVVGHPMSADEIRAQRARVRAAAADRHTDGLAFDVLNAGATWPLGTAHYLRRLEERMAASYRIPDIFAWFKNGLVHYLFMGQMLITINRECVDALTLAEKHYFDWWKRVPGAGFVVATKGTGAYNFRAHSKGKRLLVLQKLWRKTGDGRLVHISGRAIDINYPFGRNPRVIKLRMWAVVRAVLRFAGENELAAIDYTKIGKDFDTLARILDASEAYRAEYAAWKRALPGSLLLPQTSIPTASSYARALRAAGHHKKAPAFVAARRVLDRRRDDEDDARAAYLAVHRRVPRRAADAIVGVLKQIDELSQMDRLRISMQAKLWGTLVTAKAALRRWQKAAKEAGKGRKVTGLRRQSESARDAVVAARDMIGARLDALGIDPNTLDIDSLRAAGTVHDHEEWLARAYAILPRADVWLAVDDVAKDYARTRRRTDDAAAAQPIVDVVRATRELEVVTVWNAYHRDFDTWGRHGFTDHESLFVWAMYRGGWCWGAEFQEEDLHHFQLIPWNRYCKGGAAGDEPP